MTSGVAVVFVLLLNVLTAYGAITLNEFNSVMVSTAEYCVGTSNSVQFFAPQQTAAACAAAGNSWNILSTANTNAKFQAMTVASEPSGSTTGLFLVKVNPAFTVTSASRAQWQKAIGVPFEDVLTAPSGTHYFLVFGTAAQLQQMRGYAAFSDAVAVPTQLKVSPELAVKLTALAATPNALVDIDIGLSPQSMQTYTGGAVALAKAWQSALDGGGITAGTFSAASANTIKLTGIKAGDIPLGASVVAGAPESMFLSPKSVYTANTKDASWLSQSGVRDDRPLFAQGLDGKGEVVGVADSGLDVGSCFFYDKNHPFPTVTTGTVYNDPAQRKVIQYAAFANGVDGMDSGHGTHVSGIVAGNSAVEAQAVYNGLAPNAKIAFFDIGLLNGDLALPSALETTMFPPAYQAGARIHSNSWGTDSNVYNKEARAVDAFSWQQQDFLVLVAAGNSGEDGPGRLYTPGTAKNCLTVGATQSAAESFTIIQKTCPTAPGVPCQNNMASFSSTGPAADGRIKPEVVAPGEYVVAAKSTANGRVCGSLGGGNSGLTVKAGTSMATPGTAGNAALARQYFREGYYPTGVKRSVYAFSPMGALLKAIIINSAAPVTGAYGTTQLSTAVPNSVQGFGRVDMQQAMPFSTGTGPAIDLAVVGDFNRMKTLDAGAQHSYTVPVTATTTMQVEGKASAGVLPLKITLVWHDPPANVRAKTTLVNNLDLVVTAPDGSRLYPNGGTTADLVNNVEQVTVANPVAGSSYTVAVVGTSVPSGPQPYALVITGSFARDPSLFTLVAPSLSLSSLPIGKTTSTFLVAGTGFSPDRFANSVTFKCAGGASSAGLAGDGIPGGGVVGIIGGGGTTTPPPTGGSGTASGAGTGGASSATANNPPTATVLASDEKALTVKLSDGWSCPTDTSLLATVTTDGLSSGSFAAVAYVSTSQEAIDNAAKAACAAAGSAAVCNSLEVCVFRDGVCFVDTGLSTGAAVAITITAMLAALAAVVGVLYQRGMLPDVKGAQQQQQRQQAPAAAAELSPMNIGRAPTPAAAPAAAAAASASRPAARYAPSGLYENHIASAQRPGIAEAPRRQPKPAVANAGRRAAGGPLPPGWETHTDNVTGVIYYHNPGTGQTQWEAPR